MDIREQRRIQFLDQLFVTHDLHRVGRRKDHVVRNTAGTDLRKHVLIALKRVEVDRAIELLFKIGDYLRINVVFPSVKIKNGFGSAASGRQRQRQSNSKKGQKNSQRTRRERREG